MKRRKRESDDLYLEPTPIPRKKLSDKLIKELAKQCDDELTRDQ